MRKSPWTASDAEALARFLYNTTSGLTLLSRMREHVQERVTNGIRALTPGAAEAEAAVRLGRYEGALGMIEFIEESASVLDVAPEDREVDAKAEEDAYVKLHGVKNHE